MMEAVVRIPITEDVLRPQMLQLREFRPFKTSNEYLWAMKEDLSDWLGTLYPDLNITPKTFMECLETGIVLCKHSNNVRRACMEWIEGGRKLPKCWGKEWKLPAGEVTFNPNARPETFFARDNVHNFITWCRKLGIFECLLFESDDLILRKNEKNVILCILEVARRGSHFGMATPLLVQFEKEIDRDIAKDTGVDLSSSGEEEESLLEYGPIPQIITNDLRSLDEMVRELVERCSCPTQFPMIRVAEGKYRIGNTKVMIYVRILRNHVMVRVGGGWDTLAHYLDKHDPCRCSSGHKVTISSKLIFKNDGPSPRMKVEYESNTEKLDVTRRDLSFDTPSGHSTPYNQLKKQVDLSDSGSEISDEGYKTSDNSKLCINTSPTEGKELIMGKGHISRKSSVTRTRSISTDEDRPDSRSTDEDITTTPRRPQQSVIKSSSTSRVPNNYLRSISSDRSKDIPMRNRQRYTSGEGSGMSPYAFQPNPKHIPITPSSAIKPKAPVHTRSLSASGKVEFFGRNVSYGSASGQKLVKAAGGLGPRSSTNAGYRSNGKNTWNGYSTGPRSRNRTNLLHTDLYRNPATNGESTNPNNSGGDLANKLPDLASCIRRALELDSDADKISHIELVIKQYETQNNDNTATPEEREASSLPFTPHAESSQCSQKPVSIKKRVENGQTKIPKPNFY